MAKAKQKDYGVWVVALVAIVAVVGLVILFSGNKKTTGAVELDIPAEMRQAENERMQNVPVLGTAASRDLKCKEKYNDDFAWHEYYQDMSMSSGLLEACILPKTMRDIGYDKLVAEKIDYHTGEFIEFITLAEQPDIVRGAYQCMHGGWTSDCQFLLRYGDNENTGASHDQGTYLGRFRDTIEVQDK